MKKIFLLSTLVLFTFTACEKDLYDEELANQEKTIKDLVVPQDFNWEMTQTVTVNLTATVETEAAVYTNKNCDESSMVAQCTVVPGLDFPFAVTVPTASKELYVVYNGIKETVAINNNAANLVLAGASTGKAMTRGNEQGNNEVPYYYYKPWSTIMFEDLFPMLGDYDFNDFVANYKYSVNYTVTSKDQGNMSASHVQGLDLEFRINAMGATLPITPYVAIRAKVDNEYKKLGDLLDGTITSDDEGLTFTKVASGSNFAVFKIEGVTKPEGVVYLNTEKDKTLYAPQSIKVKIKAPNQGIKADANQDNNYELDFFIYNGTHEVHKRGFGPVLGGAYPASEVEDGAGEQYYSNGNNLIWAIDIPAIINHAVEKRNFLNAYPQFRNWATSGGTQNQNWYETPVSKELINYMGAHPIQ